MIKPWHRSVTNILALGTDWCYPKIDTSLSIIKEDSIFRRHPYATTSLCNCSSISAVVRTLLLALRPIQQVPVLNQKHLCFVLELNTARLGRSCGEPFVERVVVDSRVQKKIMIPAYSTDLVYMIR